MNNPVVSIIIPVYKAEQYLRRCLDSIIAQSFHNFEVILVDDGSPDQSGEICDEYVRNDDRFTVIHKVNGGVSSARQVGIETAKGEYTIHVDPDDWIESEMLSDLVHTAKENSADMVICDFFENTKYGQKYISQKPSCIDSISILNQLLFQQLHGSCWNKLVRRVCYNDNHITFPVDIIRWEDLWVNCLLLLHSLKVVYLPKAYYHYDHVVNDNSIVRVVSLQGVESQIAFCTRMYSILADKGFVPDEIMYPSIAATKMLMYTSGFYTVKGVRYFYPSANDRFIEQYNRFSLYTLPSYCLSLALQNHQLFAKILYRVVIGFVIPVGSKLKKFFNRYLK